MAEFDCADMTVNVAECAKPIKVQAALSIASTIAVWLVLAWSLSRSRSRF